MQTAVSEPVIGSFEIDPFIGSPPGSDDPVPGRPATDGSGRVYTVRRNGRPAFEGPFEDAYTWAITRGDGPVTLTSFHAAGHAAGHAA